MIKQRDKSNSYVHKEGGSLIMVLHKKQNNHLRLKRIYEKAEPEDGYRILVDRLWPRGISKQKSAIDEWMKEIAPSPELRKWFGHEPGGLRDLQAAISGSWRKTRSAADLLQRLMNWCWNKRLLWSMEQKIPFIIMRTSCLNGLFPDKIQAAPRSTKIREAAYVFYY